MMQSHAQQRFMFTADCCDEETAKRVYLKLLPHADQLEVFCILEAKAAQKELMFDKATPVVCAICLYCLGRMKQQSSRYLTEMCTQADFWETTF